MDHQSVIVVTNSGGPSVTDWIAAAAASVAAVGTVGTLWATRTVLKRQIDDQERAQASRVSVLAAEGTDLYNDPVVEVHNNSDHAISAVVVGVHTPHFTAGLETQPSVILAGRSAPVSVRTMVEVQLENDPDLDQRELRVLVSFTDERGRRWMLHATDNRLTRLHEHELSGRRRPRQRLRRRRDTPDAS